MSWLSRLFSTEEEEEKVEETWKQEKNSSYKISTNNEREINNMNLRYNVIKPKRLDDVNKGVELMKKGEIVTFVIEYLNKDEGQRLVDFASGAIKAVNGLIIEVSDKVYTCLPSGLEYIKVDEEGNK